MNEIPINKRTFEELQAKLKELKTVKRPRIAQAIKEAREAGDLRENSAYHAAKDEQGLNESRIKELEAQLRNVRVVDELERPKDRAVIGATVRIRDLGTEEEMEYTLVSELEADIFANKISNASPLGEALLGRKLNDTVKLEVPRGLVKYRIIGIT